MTTARVLGLVPVRSARVARRSAGAPDDALGQQELVEAVLAALQAEAALLVAAEGGVRARPGAAAVDVDHPGPDPLGDLVGAHRVGGPDAAAEPELAVVGQPHRLVVVVEPDDHADRAEELLAGDRHRVVDVDEQRRLDEEALVQARRPAAAVGDLRALGLPGADQALDLLPLGGADQRAHGDVGVGRVPDLDLVQRRLDQADQLVQARAVDQGPGQQGAALPGVGGHGEHHRRDDPLEVGVGGDDVGRLAAELEHDLLQRRRGLRVHQPADRVRAGEADDVHPRVGGQRLPGRRVAGDDVEHPRRQPRLVGHLAEDERLERGGGGGLEHHRAPGGQGRRELEDVEEQREVVGGDQRGHAVGLAADDAPGQGRPHRRRHRLLERELQQDPLGHVPEVQQRDVDLEGVGQRPGRPGLAHGQFLELAGPALHRVRHPEHDRGPLAGAEVRPRALVEGPPGGGHGPVHVARGAVGDRADDLLGRRVEHGEDRVALAVLPRPVDVEPVRQRSHGASAPSVRSDY